MIPRLAWSVLLVLLGAGCARGPHAGRPARHKAGALPPPTREIYLTGYVQHDDVTGQDTLVDLTVGQPNGQPIAPNTPLSYEHEAMLHIRDVQTCAVHDYHVLVGPDFESGAPVACKVKTSTATLDLTIGWAMLVGQLPVAETDQVSTSPEGTLMAVRVQKTPDQHYVYNLEPPSSCSAVKVTAAGQTVCLQPGMYVVVPRQPAGVLQPAPIPANDAFVTHMRTRAGVAAFDMTR
jgi:hypothetical protein